MSAAIHYKLKSAKDYDTYRFDGAGIPVWELKNEIIERKKLGKSDDFDLVILNAQTNEEYADDSSIIPRNTSVVVKRVPVAKGSRPKRLNTNNAYIPQSMVHSLQAASNTAHTGHKEEDDRINKMMTESTSHWVHTQQQSQQQQQQGGHQVRRVMRPKGPNPIPPPTYTCFRCGQPGHYINFCPTNDDPTFDRPRIKKTTGIPRAFLRTVDPHLLDNPSTAIMVTSEGAAVIATPNETEWERVTAERHFLQSSSIPQDLRCAICEDLLASPRRLSCCKALCCEECLLGRVEETNRDSNDDNDDGGRKITCPTCRRVTLFKTVTVAEDAEERLKAYHQIPFTDDDNHNNVINNTASPQLTSQSPSESSQPIKQQQDREFVPVHEDHRHRGDREDRRHHRELSPRRPPRHRHVGRSPPPPPTIDHHYDRRHGEPRDYRNRDGDQDDGRYYRDRYRSDERQRGSRRR